MTTFLEAIVGGVVVYYIIEATSYIATSIAIGTLETCVDVTLYTLGVTGAADLMVNLPMRLACL